MTTFGVVMACLFAGFLLAILALGRWSARGPRDFLDWKPTRPPEREAAGDAEDAAEMLAALNRLRRRRGAPERTEAEVLEVPRDQPRRSRPAC